MRKVLIHSDVTDFGRCQEQIGQGQKERRQIAGGGGSHGVVAQKHAEVRERCLVHVPASRGQPTKVGPNAGRGRGAHLERQAQRAVPEELREHAPGAADAEEDRVVVVLLEAVVPAQGEGGFGSSWRGTAAAARGRALCRAWRAGRGVPGEAGPVASRAGGDGVEETARGTGRVTPPRGRGESDCAPQHACALRAAVCLWCAGGSVHAACRRRGAYLSSTPLCESTFG